MNNQSDTTGHKTNNSIVKSLVSGLLSLLIYALSLPLTYAIQSDVWIVIAFIAGVSGITFCIISLNASNEAIKQLKGNNNIERNYGVAIAGRILGILCVLASVFFCVLMFFGLIAQ